MKRKRTSASLIGRVLVSYKIKFNETKTTPITDEFYGEQEIGNGYGDEWHVKFVPSSSQDEIKKEGINSDLKLDEGQDALLQDSRDKKPDCRGTKAKSARM